MLNSARRYWPAALIAAFFAVVLFGEWSSAQNDRQNNPAQPTANNKPFEILWPSAEGWTAIFTGLLTVSTIGLWSVTRIAANAARDAAEAFPIVERAFIFLDEFNYELTTAADARPMFDLIAMPARYNDDPGLFITRFAIQPKWKNGGNTPTRRMTIQVNWQGPPVPIPPNYDYRNAPESFFLAPRATEPSGFIEIPAAQALVDFGAFHPVGAAPMIFIWGRTDYEDVFGKPHFTQWCYQLRLERHRQERMSAGFIQWGDYNRSDEDERT